MIDLDENKTPEAIIAEAMVSAGAPLMHSRVEEAVAGALRKAGMLAEQSGQVCAWCPSPARGSAHHNDGKLHPSCGQTNHGQGWVPDYPVERIGAIEAERDAALAAVAAVRELHRESEAYRETCVECSAGENLIDWPCRTIAALDGAPEPDREVQLERVAARLREIVYLCGDDLGCQCEEAQDASADLAMELSIIAAERPTLTANEVWAIAKAEHDYANDSDNVGAFVDSLTDALRTAGVAFDEQPFIDSGYLLPVEGGKP